MAIQAAVDTGLDVYFEGAFTIETSIVVGNDTGQTLWGPGTLQLADSRSLGTTMFEVFDANKITFRYLKFDGNKANQTKPDAAGGWDGATERVYFTAVNTVQSSNVKFEQCTFHDISTVSLNFRDSEKIEVEQSHFHDSHMDALYSSNEPNSRVELSRNTIERMTYRDEAGDIVYRYGNGIVLNATDLLIADNVLHSFDRSAIKPSSVAGQDRNYIVRNKITNPDWQGINPHGGSFIEIIDNEIEGTGFNGILLGRSTDYDLLFDIIVRGNTIYNAGYRDTGDPQELSDAIRLTGKVARVQIEDNDIDTTSRFGLTSSFSHDVNTARNTIRNTAFEPVYLQGSGAPGTGLLTYNFSMDGDKLYCGGVANQAIMVKDQSYNLTFTGVEMSNCLIQGIDLYYTDNVLIDDCTFDTTGQYGVRIRSATDTTIQNSSITNNIYDGIVVAKQTTEPDGIDVINNTFLDVGRDGTRLYGVPTNVTHSGNTYTNIGGVPVYWVP